MKRSIKVELGLKTNEEVAQELAFEVLRRANSHDSELVERKLEQAGITLDRLAKYFQQLQLVVAEFWNAQYDLRYKTVLKPHEVRSLYLPTLYAVVLSSVGNIKIGNYEYVIKANEAGEEPDKDFILEFSVKLESLRQYVSGDTGQIGNRNAEPQTSVMLAILSETHGLRGEIGIRDGATYDPQLAGLAALLGLSLVEAAYAILYTGVEEVNFRELAMTVKESKPSDVGRDLE
jgi:hypothetical protein